MLTDSDIARNGVRTALESKQYHWGGILQDRVDTMKERMDRMEEQFGNLLHFINNREDSTKGFKYMIDAHAVTIMALRDWIGELELGRLLLRNRIIAIEVRTSMVASDLWN